MQTTALSPHNNILPGSPLRIYLLLLVLGGLHSLAFAVGPFPAWFLPFAQLSLFSIFTVQIYRAPGSRSAFLRGWVFSLSFFATGVHWLYNSMHVYGHIHSVFAGAAVLLFAAALAILPALACLIFSQLRHCLALTDKVAVQLILSAAWASCWTLGEWLRGTLFTGFPWLNIAYAHLDGPLGGWAAIVGAYGMVWLAAFGSASIACLVINKDVLRPIASGASLCLAIILGLAGAGLHYVQWAGVDGKAFIVRLVQGNIPQSEKFDPQTMLQGIERYYQLASLPAKTAAGKPSLIVLPETVIPMMQDGFDAGFWQQWIHLAQSFDAQIVLGIPLASPVASAESNMVREYTNSMIAIGPTSQAHDILQAKVAAYHKHHLVPFGEFIPPGFAWFVRMMQIPLGDFNRGDLPQPGFSIQHTQVAPNICYEDVFGEEIRRAVLPGPGTQGASILLNASNLAWFGSSWALFQHLQFSRLRAMETARPMLRSTNTGITAAIDAKGHVRAALAPQTVGVLDIEVQGMRGLTPYVRWGNAPAIGIMALFLLLPVVVCVWRRRTQSDN